MTEKLDDLALQYDIAEQRCNDLAYKAEMARTGLGRRIAAYRLARQQAELGQITDEYDVAELYMQLDSMPDAASK